MTTVENGPVMAHVQAFADEAHERFGTTFKTYEGHDPTRDRALDCWDTEADLDALADWAQENQERFGVDYVIWKQRIWNPEVADYWRGMADRGSVTQNHYDHVHVSFEATGSATPEEGPFMALSDEDQRYLLDLVKAMSIEMAKQADVIRGKDGIAEDVDQLLRNAQQV